MRQLLADKVSGNMVGLWLLAPEHLRLGTFDLLRSWTQEQPHSLKPRIALQLLHEAALCVTGVRQARTLSQKGFELLNGLPFVVTDLAVHQLLSAHTFEESLRLQIALGLLRRASGHFKGVRLAVDPHRVRSYSKRQMRRHIKEADSRPVKVAQTFFALDVDSGQPVCFTTSTSARTVVQATPELLELAEKILQPTDSPRLVLADSEHFAAELLDDVRTRTGFELLVPMAMNAAVKRQLAALPPEQFQRRWAGYATTRLPYLLTNGQTGPMYQFVQRLGEKPADWTFKAFLSTSDRDETEAMTQDYPCRWHIEEFFNTNQALGWNRAGTQNLNIRYGQMTLALLAQTLIHQLRQRLGAPFSTWEAGHLAKTLFSGLEGDLRVRDDTILVTYYNAPNAGVLSEHYQNLPEKLKAEHVDPRLPWLYNFKLDFRFR